MRVIKKVINFFSKNEVKRSKSKKDANLNYNTTLFFQISLISSIIIVALVINATFGLELEQAKAPVPLDSEEIWMGDFVIIEPKPESLIEPEKPIKKVNPNRVIITDNPKIDQPAIDTEPETEVVFSNDPVIQVPQPQNEPEPENDKVYSMIGLERVPVFPGCEMLTDNNQRRECMSAEIGKLINRRFDTEIANQIGLNGNQRIYVSFVINKNGELDQLQVRAPHPRLEREAERVVKMIPKMMPGIQNNREVDVMFTLPIIFNVVN